MLSTAARDGRGIGACSKCGAGIAYDGVAEGTKVNCPNCSEPVRLSYVLGNKSGYICDAMCMGATGRYCSCSCGGENHGGWLRPIEFVPVWDREKAKAVQAKRIATFNVRQAKKAAEKEEKTRAGREALLTEYPVLAELLDEQSYALLNPDNYGFLRDMRDCVQNGQMTERQINAAVRSIGKTHDRLKREAKWAEEREAVIASGASVENGRYVIEGEIITIKEEPDVYSYLQDAVVYKLLIKRDDGTKLWGSLPRTLLTAWQDKLYAEQESYEGWDTKLKGQRVKLTGTVTQSDRDATFGFYKRPAKAELLNA